jgi:uncharacterized protein Yka (UPF0111/DUF47 family)
MLSLIAEMIKIAATVTHVNNFGSLECEEQKELDDCALEYYSIISMYNNPRNFKELTEFSDVFRKLMDISVKAISLINKNIDSLDEVYRVKIAEANKTILHYDKNLRL